MMVRLLMYTISRSICRNEFARASAMTCATGKCSPGRVRSLAPGFFLAGMPPGLGGPGWFGALAALGFYFEPFWYLDVP